MSSLLGASEADGQADTKAKWIDSCADQPSMRPMTRPRPTMRPSRPDRIGHTTRRRPRPSQSDRSPRRCRTRASKQGERLQLEFHFSAQFRKIGFQDNLVSPAFGNDTYRAYRVPYNWAPSQTVMFRKNALALRRRVWGPRDQQRGVLGTLTAARGRRGVTASTGLALSSVCAHARVTSIMGKLSSLSHPVISA